MVGAGAVAPILKFFSIGYWRDALGLSFGVETLFIIFALVFVLIWGLSMGRTRSIISLLSIYVAFVITETFPFYEQLTGVKIGEHWIRVVVFAASQLVIFFIFNVSFLRKRLSSGEFNLFGVLLLTLLQLGLLASALISFLPIDTVQPYLGSLTNIFAGGALFYWFLAPLGGLLFMNYFLRG